MNKLYWSFRRMMNRRVQASIMVEIILILVVLIALVAIFKTQLTDFVGDIFDKITTNGMAI